MYHLLAPVFQTVGNETQGFMKAFSLGSDSKQK